MTDIDAAEPSSWIGRTAVGPDGGRIGTIVDVYLHDRTGHPEWVAVGCSGATVNFVPISGASTRGDDVVLGWCISTVKDAPRTGPGDELGRDDEQRLRAYYGPKRARY